MSIVDANGKTVLEMGWLMEYELDRAGDPIISERQKKDWGERIMNDPEALKDMLSDDRWESRQVFELAEFIADAINKAGELTPREGGN